MRLEIYENMSEGMQAGPTPHNFVVALAGPYGSGCSSVADELARTLDNWPGCRAEIVKVSKLLPDWHVKITGKPIEDTIGKPSDRRRLLQEAGTNIRKTDLKLIGQGIAKHIYSRGRQLEEKGELVGTNALFFLVDCLKNPYDLKVLRDIYRDQLFFLFIHANRNVRWRRAKDYKSWTDDERPQFEEYDAIDKDEKSRNPEIGEAGQRVQALAPLADYYITSNGNRDKLQQNANRFIELIFGDGKNQPTLAERTMHVAFSAANRSFCLSRQVGAAIIDSDGNLLSVGHNDVPRANGGLYTQEYGLDSRCYLVGDRRCINDTNKQERFLDVARKVCKRIELKEKEEEILAVLQKSSFADVTEYCRAVHAEMEALLALTRIAGPSSKSATMCVTTQPCHNCTKHIIAAGISKVLYMEPYPKSLAEELHSDAVQFDPVAGEEEMGKVLFVQYEGVAPARYHDFFRMYHDRKSKDGVFIRRKRDEQSAAPRLGGDEQNTSRTRKDLSPMIERESEAHIAFDKAATAPKDQKKTG